MRIRECLCVLLAVLTLTACATGPNTPKNTVDRKNSVAGFWEGLLPGFLWVWLRSLQAVEAGGHAAK